MPEPRRRDTIAPIQPSQVSERLGLYDDNYWVQAGVHLTKIMLYDHFDFETRRKFTGPGMKVSKEGHFIVEVYRKQLARRRRSTPEHC
jgi:hypothetical protein